ncbi:MAG: phenylacetate--CoA ligase family protein [Desulfobacteraceae bacterium]|nr:MAG: phenylacetate--CoA ligase family protein [Desulfobacteraceae bacterium]
MIKDEFLSMNREEKIQLQLERLQSTLNRAYRNVPFHKKRFKDMGIDISDINQLSDLARLPFMERHHISDNYPYDLFAVPLRDIVRIHTAPGTTQKPTVSGYTPQDLSVWQNILTRALLASDITPHDILQITLPPGLANWGRDYKSGAEAIEASVIPHTPMSIEKKVMVLMDYRSSVLITTPASALQLADYVLKEEINTTAMGLKTLILVGEAIDPDTRKKLEDRLGVKVWVHYGLSEVPGPAIAFECEAHEGLHVNEDHFLPEIVDPVSGDVLAEDRFGELVLTTLTTRAFPLIRFKTGDRARIIRAACSCGRQLRRIEWAGERTDELLNIDGVKIQIQQMQTAIQSLLGLPPAPPAFHVRKIDRKCIEVWIPVNDAIFSDEVKELEALIHRAEANLLENIGIPVVIRLKENRTD